MPSLKNLSVTHVSLGIGTIINQTETTIEVKFAEKTITMGYPLAFEKYLKLENEELTPQINLDIQKVHAENAERRQKDLDRIEKKLKENLEKEDDDKKLAKTPKVKVDCQKILDHTLYYCEDNDTIRPAYRLNVKNQAIILETEELDSTTGTKDVEVIFSDKRIVESAKSYKDKKVCIVNPASEFNIKEKSVKSATEEEISMVSTLHKYLANPLCWEKFYKPHKLKGNSLKSDAVIYSPDVIVFKTDTEFPELIEDKSEWFTVDVLTVAPPELSKSTKTSGKGYPHSNKGLGTFISETDFEDLLVKRLTRVFEVAHSQGAEVIIANDFGSKENHIPVRKIAEAYKTVIAKCGNWFDTIEFAIPVKNPESKSNKLKIFKDTI